MAYNTKYQLDYSSLEGRQYQLLLKKNNYEDSIFNIKGASSPVVFNTPNKNKKYSPIVGTEARIQLVHNYNETQYNLLEDFREITDRQWQAEFKERITGLTYQAFGKIDALDITGYSIPARIDITMDQIPTIIKSASCYHQFEKTAATQPGVYTTFYLYAKPASENYFGSNWIKIAQTTNDEMDTQEQIIIGLAMNNHKISVIDSTTLFYTDTNADSRITNNYNLKIVAESPYLTYQNTDYRFNVTIPERFTISWKIKNEGGAEASTVVLAETYTQAGDNPLLLLNRLKNQINGGAGYFLIENVKLNDGTVTNIRIQADTFDTPARLRLFLLDIGTTGNGIAVSELELNQTYLQINASPNSEWDYTYDTSFQGGSNGGDTFTFETSIGNVSVYAGEGETAENIIARLVDAINSSLAHVDAYINSADLTSFFVTIQQDMSAETYHFTTDGASILSDDGPSWAAVSSYITKWIGFITPGFNQNTQLPDNTIISMSALCGLGDLKNFSFSYNDKRPFEKLTILEILKQILSNTNLGLRIYEAFDAWSLFMNPAIPPLEQVYEDTLRLNGASNYTVLEELMILLRSEIRQINGHWEIRPLENLIQSSFNYRVYSANAVFISEFIQNDHIISVGKDSGKPFIGGSTILKKTNAFRELITEQNFGFVSQLIKFPNFSNLNENLDINTYNAQYPWKWTYNDINYTTYLDKVNVEADGYLRIQEKGSQTNVFALSQKLIIGDILEKADVTKRQYELQVEYESQNNTNSLAADYIQIQVLFIGSYTYYLLTEDPDNPVDNPVTVVNHTISIEAKSDAVSKQKYTQSFNFPFYPPEDSCEVVVKIIQPTNGFIKLKKVGIEVNASVVNKERISAYYTDLDSEGIQFKNRISSVVENQTFNLGDSPDIPASEQLYKNSLFVLVNGRYKTTHLWSKNPSDSDPLYDSLMGWLRKSWMNEYAVSFDNLLGTIKGIELHNIIKDITDKDKLYLCIGGSWDTRNDTVNGNWQQIDVNNFYTNFPSNLVEEILPTEKESGGTNSYSGSSGGSTTPTPPAGEITFPVTSVNGATGDINLTTDNIPEGVNKYVTTNGKNIAERGGRVIEASKAWNGLLEEINLTKERARTLSMNNGVTEIQFILKLPTDAGSYSRRNVILLDNGNNVLDITTLTFNEANGNWIWIQGSPPESILTGEKYVLMVENINANSVIARMEKVTGALANEGIGFWIIEDTFVVQ